MKKTIVFDDDEYGTIISALAFSCLMLDKYVEKEDKKNKKKGINTHVADLEETPTEIRKLYSIFENMETYLKIDVIKKILEIDNEYFNIQDDNKVLSDEYDYFS